MDILYISSRIDRKKLQNAAFPWLSMYSFILIKEFILSKSFLKSAYQKPTKPME